MKICLIALPWHDHHLPQPSLGALAAYLRKVEPSWTIETAYPYVDVATQGEELYGAISAHGFEGERLYAALMYGRGVDRIVEDWEALPPTTVLGEYLHSVKQRGVTVRDVVERVIDELDHNLDSLVAARDWSDAIIGLTTSFSQLFGNLLLARRIKASDASSVIVLGGSTVSPAAIADSVVAVYDQVDYVIRGEGELPLHALAQHLERGDRGPLPQGVVARGTPAVAMWQVPDLDVLPAPDYDAFFARVGPGRSRTRLAIEGSRGCWWDRTTKNPRSTCQFCNLNVQWEGYRQKSARNIASVMRELADRYHSTHFAFLDNIVRTRGLDDFLTEIVALGFDARIFHEARANMRPYDILRFYEAGLRTVQFGIEGLSTRFLQRINKGTTAIMNLEVMKTCVELGVASGSNLIVGFPGSTQAEVDETVEVIDRYAFAYEPLMIAEFSLAIDSAVMRFPDDFGLVRLRNHDAYADVVSPEDLARLVTFQRSFDFASPQVSWAPVQQRVESWRRDYRRHPTWYLDGGTFLNVYRKRPGTPPETIELVGDEAHIYRFCLEIRQRAEILQKFAGDSADHAAEVDAILASLVARLIMFQEGARFLALAPAADATVAARRIRANREHASSRQARKLAVIGNR
jgi:ribosomal peptide maturation radical SAM protein 1